MQHWWLSCDVELMHVQVPNALESTRYYIKFMTFTIGQYSMNDVTNKVLVKWKKNSHIP